MKLRGLRIASPLNRTSILFCNNAGPTDEISSFFSDVTTN